MKNVVIVYKSKYGSTKQYAEWIATELGASVFDVSSIKPSQLINYDVVVFGGGLYASGINGVKLVTKNPWKGLVVFTVGAGNPRNTDYSVILSKNFPNEILSKIKVFHFHGGIDYEKLGIIHRIMMAMVKKIRVNSKSARKRTDEDIAFLETYGSKFDFKDKASIKPLIDYVRAL